MTSASHVSRYQNAALKMNYYHDALAGYKTHVNDKKHAPVASTVAENMMTQSHKGKNDHKCQGKIPSFRHA
jgi:hypothetical protein